MHDKNQIHTSRTKTGRLRCRTQNKELTLTQQQFKDECDVNNIMRKYVTTGEFVHRTSKKGQYADFSHIKDYQEMLDTVRYAEEAFASLPAPVRSRFKNDPGELLSFIQDPKNRAEGEKLGLFTKTDTQKINDTINPASPPPPQAIPPLIP